MGYAKEIYQQARTILDERRQKAIYTQKERRDALYDTYPRLRALERELAETGISAAKAALSQDVQSTCQLEAVRLKNLTLQEERSEILSAAGLPGDYLALQYTCPLCKDTGYIAQKRCACMEELLRKLACDAVSETGGLRNCRFETFSLSYYSDIPDARGASPRSIMEKVLHFCMEYAGSFTMGSQSILLFGGTGLGKTHLSLAIAYEVIERGYGVYYSSCQSLMDKLQAQQFGRLPSGDAHDYQSLAINCDLLVLDDFGAEFSTTFTVAALQNLINQRLSEQRPTVINTNLSDTQLGERYGDRLVSRLLCAYRAIPVYGKDIRKLKRFQEAGRGV